MLQKLVLRCGSKFLTYTVTHTGKRVDGNNGRKSAGQEICGSCPAFFLPYMTCSMKLPMVWAASSRMRRIRRTVRDRSARSSSHTAICYMAFPPLRMFSPLQQVWGAAANGEGLVLFTVP